jgi:hypothetical protein
LLAANSAGVIIDERVSVPLVITCPQLVNARVAAIGTIKENEYFMSGLS